MNNNTEENLPKQIDSAIAELLADDISEKQIVKVDDTHLTIKEQAYEVVVDYRQGFDFEAFSKRYQEYFAKYDFIVGDWGFEQLRLKGFFQVNQPKVARDQLISFLDDYLKEYCNFGCQYFVLAKENAVEKFEALKLKRQNSKPEVKENAGSAPVSTRKPQYGRRKRRSNQMDKPKGSSETPVKSPTNKKAVSESRKPGAKRNQENVIKKNPNKDQTSQNKRDNSGSAVKPVIKPKAASSKSSTKPTNKVATDKGAFVIKQKKSEKKGGL
ncbi:YutD family protein [Vaginisenegalia massiliensis]|uniref:YutD family protein n=1 Tax=Vaginisenegalia massiliensis TaxID=2058294 RepID=UPI000F5329CB|nr:YutD family protein [Vaginisenegalia massiliensis]